LNGRGRKKKKNQPEFAEDAVYIAEANPATGIRQTVTFAKISLVWIFREQNQPLFPPWPSIGSIKPPRVRENSIPRSETSSSSSLFYGSILGWLKENDAATFIIGTCGDSFESGRHLWLFGGTDRNDAFAMRRVDSH
jgi:hypothetical protein